MLLAVVIFVVLREGIHPHHPVPVYARGRTSSRDLWHRHIFNILARLEVAFTSSIVSSINAPRIYLRCISLPSVARLLYSCLIARARSEKVQRAVHGRGGQQRSTTINLFVAKQPHK